MGRCSYNQDSNKTLPVFGSSSLFRNHSCALSICIPALSAVMRHLWGVSGLCKPRVEGMEKTKKHYVVVRGLTEVWELKGEGPCWKGLGL